jgi:transposase
MKEKLRFLGLIVHAETIAVAIAESDGEVRSLGTRSWHVAIDPEI